MSDNIGIVCADPSHKGGDVWRVADFGREANGWKEQPAPGRIPVAGSTSRPSRGVTTKPPRLEYLVGERVATPAERLAYIVNPARAPEVRVRYDLSCGLCSQRVVRTEAGLFEVLDQWAAIGVLEIPLSALVA